MRMISWLFLTLITFIAWAQQEPKHPRAVELEEKLADEASKYYTLRFPNQPFYIKVEVQPLRSEVNRNEKMENLPYYEYESEDGVDAWDDPNVSLSFLRNRVKRILMEVSVPVSMDDKDMQEIKDSMTVFLKLLPYRDEIKVERKLTSHFKVPEAVYYLAPIMLVALLGIGLWLRISVKNLANGLKSSNSAGSINTGSGINVSASGAGSGGGVEGKLSVQKVPPIRGDINFYDPIKMLEVLHLKIKQVVQNTSFPTLQDMMVLEKVAEENPGALGALISEFPTDNQKTILQLGRSSKWLEAFAFPTQIDQSCIKALEEITRNREFKKSDRDWENLVIQLWRLDEKLVGFIKEMNVEHAFVVLGNLPKNVALKVAKKAFPGNWGRVLDDHASNVVVDPNSIRDYYRKAIILTPYLDYKLLDSYKKEKEILDYVRTASVDDERDIYETLPVDSFIMKVRPPFYKIFEEDEDSFKKFAEQFALNEWAVALINSPRQYIKRLMDTLDDKKRFVFSTQLKRLDDNVPQINEQIEMRERFAAHFKSLKVAAEVSSAGAEQTNKNGGHIESQSA